MRVFGGRGQPTCEQLIDRYRIGAARSATCWWTTCANARRRWTSPPCRNFAYLLGKLFWADLEAHHPGISSLKLPARRRRRVEAAGDDQDHDPAGRTGAVPG